MGEEAETADKIAFDQTRRAGSGCHVFLTGLRSPLSVHRHGFSRGPDDDTVPVTQFDRQACDILMTEADEFLIS